MGNVLLFQWSIGKPIERVEIMNIFKKIFSKLRKKKETKKQECWYNNAHEDGVSKFNETEGLMCTPNHMDYAVTNQIAKRPR